MLPVCFQITGFNILLTNFINIFKVKLILSFELNILNDLKIIDYRKFYLMQQYLLTIIIYNVSSDIQD